MTATVPDRLARRMLDVWGDRAAAWLDAFPALLAYCEQRWSLKILPHVDYLSYNYVAPAVLADGADVILKLGVPNDELSSEIEALRLYDGAGAVRLLDADAARGILLLERLRPGTALEEIRDDQAATAIAGRIAGKLWRSLPGDHPFPTVARWAAGLSRLREHFGGGTGPFPGPIVSRAEALFAELLAEAGPPMLLHGDLNRGNILAAEREPWLAIDPKGAAGDPGYDLAIIVKDLLEDVSPEEARCTVANRADQLSEMLGYDRARLLRWAFAQEVLSAWWCVEDHGQVSPQIIGLTGLLHEVAP